MLGALQSLTRAIANADTVDQVMRGSTFAHAMEVAEHEKRGLGTPLPWTPLVEAGQPPPTRAQIDMLMQRVPDATEADVLQMWHDMTGGQNVFVNSRYQVAVRELADAGVHLSIKRLDQLPVHDWRDLQRIKDELVGPECEAIELYPAASRLVDTSTQFHLWAVRDPAFRFPFGFNERMVETDDDGGPAAQRPPED